MRGSVAQPGTACAQARTVVRLADPLATARAGAAIASVLEGGMIVTLSGDVGAGKTTLVRGVLRARGIEGAIKSPTYALVEQYRASSLYFYHIDFYRFADPEEWETTGLTECFAADNVCLIEWPERVAKLLPAADVALSLAVPAGGDGRTLAAQAFTARGKRCVDAIARAFPGATVAS